MTQTKHKPDWRDRLVVAERAVLYEASGRGSLSPRLLIEFVLARNFPEVREQDAKRALWSLINQGVLVFDRSRMVRLR